MKFSATKIDLDLELVTLEGEDVKLSPKAPPTAEETMNTMNIWKTIEKEENTNAIQILAKQLAFVYPKPYEWFLRNFDIRTLSDMVVFVATAMGGVRKNG